MSRKLPGSAIVPGTITVTQITGGLNDTTNASYAQANTARTTANDAYGQANTARDQANTARTQANTAYDQANNARGQANTAYGQANAAYDQANASYNVANTKLASAGGTLSGDLIITGNLTVSGNSTTLNTEVLTVEDAEVILLSNVASTPALNAGIIVNRGTSTNTFLRWNETLDEWGWSDNGTTTYYFEDLRAGLATTNTTFGTVNTSLGTINTSYQAAYAQANTARNTANSAYGQANTATTNAGNAYDTANSAYTASNRLITQDLRTIAPNSHTAGRLTFGFTSYTNNGNASSYADYLHFRSYIDSSGGSDNLVMFHKSGIGMRIWQQTWNSSTAYSNYVDVLHSSNYSSYAVPLSGGTMTGQLNISAGGLLVTGNSNFDSGTLFVDSVNDRIGIGTTNPLYHLMVLRRAGSTITAPLLNLQSQTSGSVDGDSFILFGTQSANWSAGVDQADSNKFRIEPSTTLGAADGLTITTAGNVGIGTSSPAYPLQVRRAGGSCSLGLTMDNYGAIAELARSIFYYAIGDSTSDRTGHLFFTRDATATDNLRLVINSAGNVGIGTASPASLLDVRGSFGAGSGGTNFVVTNDGDGMTRIGPNLSATGASRLNLQDRASSYISLYVATTLKARLTVGGGNDVGVEVGGTEVSRFHTGGLIVNGTSPVNGAPLTAIRTDLSSSLSVGYFGTGSQGLFIKNDSSDSKYMQFYSSGNSAGGYRFYVGNTLAFQLDTGAGATFYGSGSFSSSVMCYKSTQSSANGDYLGDLDGYGGSSYDGFYAVSRPGYSSFVMQFNPGGSAGTIQFAGSYAAAMYRRNKTDNTTWSSWRQVD